MPSDASTEEQFLILILRLCLYFPQTSGRESIAAKLVANLITKSGCDRVIALDLHSGQCAGYFDIPVDHIAGSAVALDYLVSAPLKGSGHICSIYCWQCTVEYI